MASTHTVVIGGINIKTTVIDDAKMVNAFIKEMRSAISLNGEPVVGLVVGLKPNNKISTLQLCVGLRCLHLQLCHFSSIPKSLADFLGDPDIFFVGVGIEENARKLGLDYRFKLTSVFELGPLSAWLLGEPLLAGLDLICLVREVVRINIEKPDVVTVSDWDAETLSMENIEHIFASFASYLIAMNLLAVK